MITRTISTFAALFLLATAAHAQQGYEFEVYSTDVSARGAGEIELHTNFVTSGSQSVDEPDGRATHRAVRSSLEVSTGIASW
ncbi:MAG TPA: hypothetical protein VK491_07625, partial [Gemmatimonadaceae bacterium]|nr:hypothetical protein [Gemmatimonadaceae bacterium]